LLQLGVPTHYRAAAGEKSSVGRTDLKIGRRGVLAAAGGLLAAPAPVRAQGQSNGVALVIGNSKYKWEASLPNVQRDAPDVAKRFRALGLKTELLQDAGHDAMRAAIDRFAAGARGANLAAFYFAGHGVSWDKETYLVPGDADLGNPSTVPSLVPVSAVSAAMREASHRLLVFDNCRNNPADGWRQRDALLLSRIADAERAAAALQSPNTLVMFSTAPGRVAVDGPAEENSPFTLAFLRQLAGPTVDLQALPANLRRDLLIATEGRQVLWDHSTLDRPLLLTNSLHSPSAGARGKVATDAAQPKTSLQIVELPNAYAFAREKRLPLPAGLIALRRRNGSLDNEKVGSFKSTVKVMVGSEITSTAGTSLEPLLMVILSVSDRSTAEIIYAFKNSPGGDIWRYATAALSGPKLEFDQINWRGNGSIRWEFKWRTADAGTSQTQFGGIGFFHNPFSRLDG
jgi:hypothetical protein